MALYMVTDQQILILEWGTNVVDIAFGKNNCFSYITDLNVQKYLTLSNHFPVALFLNLNSSSEPSSYNSPEYPDVKTLIWLVSLQIKCRRIRARYTTRPLRKKVKIPRSCICIDHIFVKEPHNAIQLLA